MKFLKNQTIMITGGTGSFGQRCVKLLLKHNPKKIIILNYQLALVTPGISPRRALSLKQIRHIPNLRINARGLPQMLHRLYWRTLNFCCRFCLATSAFFAIFLYFLSGRPIWVNKHRPCSSF